MFTLLVCLPSALARNAHGVIWLTRFPEDRKLISFYQCDVSDRDEVRKAGEAVRSDLGAPSILINNAGIGNAVPILELSAERVKKTFGVNAISSWFTVQEFLPGMIAMQKGHIMSVASLAAFIGLAGTVEYCATKVNYSISRETKQSTDDITVRSDGVPRRPCSRAKASLQRARDQDLYYISELDEDRHDGSHCEGHRKAKRTGRARVRGEENRRPDTLQAQRPDRFRPRPCALYPSISHVAPTTPCRLAIGYCEVGLTGGCGVS